MSETALDFFSTIAQDFAAAYKRDPDFQDRYRIWTRLLDHYAKDCGSALDMGCGSGIFSFYLAKLGLTVTGVDGAPGMIRLCEEYRTKQNIAHCRFHTAKIPVDPATLPKTDLLISSSVLEYIENIDEVLRSFSALLKDGGLLIFSLPNRQSLYRRLERCRFLATGKPEYYRFVRQVWVAEECAALLDRFGFHCEEIAYYGHANPISRLARLFLPPRYTENLFVGVFRKRDK